MSEGVEVAGIADGGHGVEGGFGVGEAIGEIWLEVMAEAAEGEGHG